MKFLLRVQQQWRKLLLGHRFMQLVRAPYGDFAGIGKLAAVTSDSENLKLIIEFLYRDPQTKRALEERPLLGKVDLEELHQLPPGTFGYCYADHMISNSFTPPSPQGKAENPYVFLGQHLGETHDIWHVVTGSDTTVAGEMKLQAFCIAQIYPSKFWIALLAKNLLKTAIDDIDLCGEHMDALVQGWLLGKQAKPLFGIEWNTLWETPLETLQAQLNLQPQQLDATLLSQNQAVGVPIA